MKYLMFIIFVSGCTYGPSDKELHPGDAKYLDEAKADCEAKCSPRKVAKYWVSVVIGKQCLCKMEQP